MNKTHAIESTFILLAYAKAIKAIKNGLKRMFYKISMYKFRRVLLVIRMLPLHLEVNR